MSQDKDRRTVDTPRCPVCEHGLSEDLLQAPDRFHGRLQVHKLVRCSSCSMVWLENAPCPEEMGKHYGPDYDRTIGAAGETSPGRWHDRWETLSKYKTSGSLLDIGCSSGSFLKSLGNGHWELYGIEMSPEAAKKAVTRSGAQVFVGDVLSAPFEPESFDVITCFDVLEHLYNPRQVMTKVREWLKPDGVFYVLVPNIESAESRIFKTYWYGLELPRHLSHFSPKSLKRLAEIVGLRELALETARNSSLTHNLRYVNDEILRKCGISRTPLAKALPPSFAGQVFYKLLRVSGSLLLSPISSSAGRGESIHAVFARRE
jgi:2-polyprenyl-3-methyl-5-hydroxy-6-metoxy-1,4-benzoquinol methylase